MYLLIQNPGEAPVEGFTLLGVSTTRDCGVSGVIGQFGSGTKHSINVLLRAGMRVIAYCGKTKLEFLTRTDTIADGLCTKEVKRVYVQFGGTSTKLLDLGWVLDFGAIDWTEVGMALREFISNAIDRTLREESGQFEAAIHEGRLAVRKVPEMDMRAKSGYTRVYIEATPEVDKYLAELPKRFLHFSDRPSDVKRRFLPKTDRNLTERRSAMIYREGVLVRELQDSPVASLYDYNFPAKDICVDESRNSNEYTIRASCAKLMRDATVEELLPVLRSIAHNEATFEAGFDAMYLCSDWETPKEEQKRAWTQAWKAVAGDSVICDSNAQRDLVARKGFTPVPITASSWAKASAKFGILTATAVLSTHEAKGRVACDVTPAATQAVATVWSWLESFKMTRGMNPPQIACFNDVTDAEIDVMGYYENGTVFIRADIASGENDYLLKTALEECVHYVTGSGDNSRDIQNYLIDLVVALAS